MVLFHLYWSGIDRNLCVESLEVSMRILVSYHKLQVIFKHECSHIVMLSYSISSVVSSSLKMHNAEYKYLCFVHLSCPGLFSFKSTYVGRPSVESGIALICVSLHLFFYNGVKNNYPGC